jgi:hypothetical protein
MPATSTEGSLQRCTIHVYEAALREQPPYDELSPALTLK